MTEINASDFCTLGGSRIMDPEYQRKFWCFLNESYLQISGKPVEYDINIESEFWDMCDNILHISDGNHDKNILDSNSTYTKVQDYIGARERLYLENYYIPTKTSIEQIKTEKMCKLYLESTSNIHDNYDEESYDTENLSPMSFENTELTGLINGLDFLIPERTDTKYNGGLAILDKDIHAQFLLNSLKNPLPENMISLDSSKVWILYWICHSLELLDSLNLSIWSSKIRKYIESLWNDTEGGFGGNCFQLAHLAPTYAAVASIIMSQDTEAYKFLDRQKIYQFLIGMKDKKSGGFMMHQNGEVDMRGAYCAIAVASMLNMITDELIEGVIEYITRCQTFEGGISGEMNMEAHGGYTYCGFATLCILGEAHRIDLEKLLHWSCNRQTRNEGGFQGRINKLVDSCYSFWMGSVFSLLFELFRQKNFDNMGHCKDTWYNCDKLQLYILNCCQKGVGGLCDKPCKEADFYHTCYALSGLSISQTYKENMKLVTGRDKNNKEINNFKEIYDFPSPDSSKLARTDPFYNIRIDRIINAKKFFRSRPFFHRSGFKGYEGAGVKSYLLNLGLEI